MEGEAGHQDAISRTDCSVKTIIGKGIKLEKLSYQFADWNRGQAENRTNQLIEQYGDKIEMIISNNDEMALGALEAYKKSKYDKKSGRLFLELTVWMMLYSNKEWRNAGNGIQ